MIFPFKKNIISKKQLSQKDDGELITLYKETENKECIGVLFERYTHLVFGLSMKYFKNEEKSKDAVMSIFESLFKKLLQYDVSNFKSWLYTLSRNYCLMELRKEKPLQRVLYDLKSDGLIVESEADLHQDIEQREEALGKAILELREEQQRCIELVYLQEKSYEETAKITGYSMKEVKSHIQNGKRNLKIRLEKNG